MGHLKDNNISYWKHWRFAMTISLSLFIHAWFPNLLVTYASDRLCKENHTKKESGQV